VTVATRLPIGLERVGGWGDTLVHPVPLDRVDLLTGRAVPAGRGIALAELLADYPVALLVPADLAAAPDAATRTSASASSGTSAVTATADTGRAAGTDTGAETDAQAEIDILEGHA
jgi:(1->4)-alpha-D-glucan 1-alpha-D-glucosylmutase